MKTNPIRLDSDLAAFLESLLWANESEDRPHEKNWTIHEFHPEFTKAVETFLSGFREYLQARIDAIAEMHGKFSPEALEDMESKLDPDQCERSFGGNVYFSLSGHGVGFWDDYSFDGPDKSARGKALQFALEAYSGNRYRFEELGGNLYKFKGQIHLAYKTAAFRREYLAKTFGGVNQAPATT